MRYFIKLLFILFVIPFRNGYSQTDWYGFPFLKNYPPQEYNASNQNWSILQDKNGVIYVGNTPCILTFDGAIWKAIETKNFTTVRSMDIDRRTGLIYVGVQNDFGYLSIKENGQTVFNSLLHLIPKKYNDFNDIWYTFVTTEGVYYVSNYLIVRLNKGKYKVWESEDGLFHTAFRVNNKIIVRKRGEGLLIFEGDKLIPIKGSEVFKNDRVDFILPFKNNSHLLGSRTLGLYSVDFNFNEKNCSLEKLDTPAKNFLLDKEITQGLQLSTKHYVIGTNKGGAIVLDTNLNIISVIDDKVGLQDLKVSALFEDKQNNLWLALDNGITCVEISSPYKTISAQNGLKGTVKSILRFNNEMYFATSQGLFVFKNKTKTVEQLNAIDCWDIIEFKKLNGSSSIIAATSGGVFEINGSIQRKISEKSCFRVLQSKKFKNTLFLGLYNGFDIMQVLDETWTTSNSLEDFDGGINDIDEDDYGNLWLCTKIDGLLYLENQNSIGLKPIFTTSNYDTSNGLTSNTDNFIYRIKNKFVINTPTNQFYKIQPIKKSTGNKSFQFTPDTLIDSIFYRHKRAFYKLNVDKNNNIWMQTYLEDLLKYDNGVALLSKNGKYKWHNKPFKRLPESQFLSILAEANGVTWFAGYYGAISFDSNTKYGFNNPFKSVFSYIISTSNKDTIFRGNFVDEQFDDYTKKRVKVSTIFQNNNSKTELSFNNNNITFVFSATSYITPENNKFSYFLEGNDETWSDWNKRTEKSYTNLWEGNYIFHLKSQDVFGNVSEEITYKFTILPPWYRTIWALVVYVILAFALLYLIVKLYTKNLQNTINEKTSEIRQQSLVIENKNKEITDSIFYAKKIQEAIMPSALFINELFRESFVLFKPKDIVSGDFYWATQKENKVLIAAADCTGHGVPGAFMSMLGNDNLNEVVIDKNILEPNEILDNARTGIIKALKQKGESGENKDGMDIGLIAFDKITNELNFAGANNPIYIIRKNTYPPFQHYEYSITGEDYSLMEIKGNKFPVGIYINNELPPFTNHTIKLEKGDSFYLFSDGYADQFGGEFGKKFKYNKLKELLLTLQDLPMNKQHELLNSTFENWKGKLEQVDDVLIIGVRI